MQYDQKEHADLPAALQSLAVCVKVAEFGMARRLRPSGGSSVNCVYTAPEVAEGSRLHLAADVYSFGVLLWELMVGRRARCVPLCLSAFVLFAVMNVNIRSQPPRARTHFLF
jgi:serine/threonine protein kinase